MSILAIIWFILIGLLFTVYAVLDGFDLGVGIWYLFSPKEDRRILQKAIAPFWDGNEVWLLAGGGALFAAFPEAYATVFSGFYLPIMLIIFALIFRAVAIEFRNEVDNRIWMTGWDIAFSAGSIIPPLIFGIAVGNLLRGIPLDMSGNYSGTFLDLFSHYTIATGLIGVMMFATHGSLYLAVKTEGSIRERAIKWAGYSWKIYFVLFMVLTILSVLASPHISVNFWGVHPQLILVPLCGLGSIIAIPLLLKIRRIVLSFFASTLSIILMMATFGISVFPNLVFQLGDNGKSLKISNASSSEKTLFIMLVIALIGMPLVIIYTIYLYRIFHRTIRIKKDGY